MTKQIDIVENRYRNEAAVRAAKARIAQLVANVSTIKAVSTYLKGI